MDRQRGRYSQQAAIDELQRRGLWGYVEPILTFGSAVAAEPVSGMMGLAALPYGADAATRAINRTQEAMTYQPRTEQGQEALQAAGEFLQPVGDAFIGASEYLGDAAYDATGSPAMGALGYSVPTMALEALGLKGASKLSKGHKAYEMGDISNYTKGLGGKQRGIFAGVKAKGADLKAMEAAKELQKRGLSRDEIWQKTGWFEDVDGQWKWEIDDSSTMTKQIQSRGSMRLPEVLEHDALYAAYPSTRMLSISRGKNGNYYSPQLDTMRVSRVESPANDIIRKYNRLEDDLLEEAHAKLERGEFNDVMEAKLEQDIKELSQRAKEEASAYSGDAFEKKTVMHELQHALQEREGFAKGGHAEQFADDYNRALHNKDYYDQEAINARLAARKTPEYKAIQSDIDAAIELDDKVSLQKLVPQRRAIEDAAARDFELESARLSEKIKLNPFEQYRRLAGEAEARNVETRLNFTPEQRRNTPPWQTLDVPEDELIVRRDGGVANSVSKEAAIKELERRGIDARSILDDSDVWLHGSPSQEYIARLQSGAERGWRGNGNAYGDGIYMTRSPKTASEFAGDAGQVLPLRHEANLFAPSGEILDEVTATALNKWAETLNESDLARLASDIGTERKVLTLADKAEAKQFFDTQRDNWTYFGGMQRTKPSVKKVGDDFVVEYTDFNAKPNFNGKTKNEALNALIHVGGKPTGDALQSAGYDGVRYLPDEAVVFDSNKVRSYFER